VSGNLANVNTTRTRGGGPYRRKEAIFSAEPVNQSFHKILKDRQRNQLPGVKVVRIYEDQNPPVMKYDPQHPHANDKGYVAMPNINLMEEMVNMISATRGYEANVTALRAAKDMAAKALEIGR
ncbi:MAG: flagellar basal body rod protein FlgC, partial [Desulfobacterales bacterium]|nr:flagellar basal body rod protein FlgC [Desulfobacterales bacterium]